MHCFGPVGNLELAEDVGDVVAHRLGTQDKAGSDLGIRLALRNQGEDLVFTLRQLREELRGSTLRGWSRRAEIAYQAPCDGWTKDTLAVSPSPNAPPHLPLHVPLSL